MKQMYTPRKVKSLGIDFMEKLIKDDICFWEI